VVDSRAYHSDVKTKRKPKSKLSIHPKAVNVSKLIQALHNELLTTKQLILDRIGTLVLHIGSLDGRIEEIQEALKLQKAIRELLNRKD
jgi:hypothetical protein